MSKETIHVTPSKILRWVGMFLLLVSLVICSIDLYYFGTRSLFEAQEVFSFLWIVIIILYMSIYIFHEILIPMLDGDFDHISWEVRNPFFSKKRKLQKLLKDYYLADLQGDETLKDKIVDKIAKL